MPREKIRRTEKVKPVDMGIVKDLKAYRLERNNELAGTGKFCNLYPDINKKVCKECSKREYCLKHQKEREFIHEQEATKGNQRRRRKQDNPKHDILEISVKTSENEELDELYEKYEVTGEEFDEDKYPCLSVSISCPEREKCNFGEKCKYNE